MVIEEIKQIRAYLFFALSFSNPVAEIPLCSERLSHFKKIYAIKEREHLWVPFHLKVFQKTRPMEM